MFEEKNVVYRYKYLPFDKGSLKTIVDGTIKFTCPLDFNDPLDCNPYIKPLSIEELGKYRPDLLKKAADLKGMKFTERFRNKRAMITKIKNKIENGNFREQFLSGFGVVSLSKLGLNPLMWSHYANFHTGFVLEFRIPSIGSHNDISKSTDRLTPIPVTYSHPRPVIKLGDEDDKSLLFKQLLTKSDIWEYEKEERVIDEVRGHGIYPYSRNEILSSVIAGLKMNEQDFNLLRDSVGTLSQEDIPTLKLYKVEDVKNEYQLFVPGHPRLDRLGLPSLSYPLVS